MTPETANKSDLSENDICTKFVAPALVAAGWNLQSQIREEETFTAGRAMVRDSQVTRGEAWCAEHVLCYKPGMPLAVTAAGRARRKETPLAWQVTLAEIKARNYNLDIKNPNAEASKHGDPDELLADYKKLLIEVVAARDALRDELAKALEKG